MLFLMARTTQLNRMITAIQQTKNRRKVLFDSRYHDIRKPHVSWFWQFEELHKGFAEYAVEKKEKHYQKCLEIIENKKEGDRIYTRGITKNAALFEDKGYSASKAIRASLLLCSGIENEKETKQAIQHSLECFKAVLGYEKIEDYAYQKNAKWIYREGKLFPDYYNLRILAFSSGWKNKEAIRTVTESVNRLAMLQPIPSIYVKVESQLVAPGSYLMHDFDSFFFG